jgi:hypothetical protein
MFAIFWFNSLLHLIKVGLLIPNCFAIFLKLQFLPLIQKSIVLKKRIPEVYEDLKKAGYSKKSAKWIGYENLTKPYIEKYIENRLTFY